MENFGIWVEKYRPKTIENLLCSEDLKSKFLQYIMQKEIPHLLFIGNAGTGKTSCAKILARDITEDVMYINASDEKGIDVVRNKIRDFCSMCGFGDAKHKIIVLDEFDHFTKDGQAALRNVMETYYKNSRFILTANYPNKIISPIISRCQSFVFKDVPKQEIGKLLVKILKTENVTFNKGDIVKIINKYFPDIRKIINMSQRLTVEGNLNNPELLDEKKELLLKHIKEKNMKEVMIIVSEEHYDFEEMYRYLFYNAKNMSNNSDVISSIMTVVGDYLYKHAIIPDHKINFLTCILEIMKLLPLE